MLLQHTDVLAARRRVLAIAPETALFDTLESLGQLERRYLARASAGALRGEARYDVIVADARRGGAGERDGLRELTRALRPGGRLIVAGAASCGGMLRRRLEAAGLLVALAACDERTHVLVAVRPAGGRDASTRRRDPRTATSAAVAARPRCAAARACVPSARRGAAG